MMDEENSAHDSATALLAGTPLGKIIAAVAEGVTPVKHYHQNKLPNACTCNLGMKETGPRELLWHRQWVGSQH
jgi:hypothetical protein